MAYWKAIFMVSNMGVLGGKRGYAEAFDGSYLNRGSFGKYMKIWKWEQTKNSY